ncbi:hypothetical protein V8C43DRAFT_276191, partial [Trichoderma afarasin]
MGVGVGWYLLLSSVVCLASQMSKLHFLRGAWLYFHMSVLSSKNSSSSITSHQYSHSPLPTFFLKSNFQPLKSTPFSTLKEKEKHPENRETKKQRLLPKLQCKKSHDEKKKKKRNKNEEREREYL